MYANRAALFLLVALLLTGGCAQRPINPPAYPPGHETLPQRWSTEGKIALRAGNKSDVMRMQWQQSSENFHIVLSGTFGLGAVTIGSGGFTDQDGSQPETIALWKGRLSPEQAASKQPLRVARDAEEMLLLETGWQLPVSLLRFWVLGVPAPESIGGRASSSEASTSAPPLKSFSQAGWNVSYPAVTSADKRALPRKMRIRASVDNTGHENNVVSAAIKASFSRWDLAPHE